MTEIFFCVCVCLGGWLAHYLVPNVYLVIPPRNKFMTVISLVSKLKKKPKKLLIWSFWEVQSDKFIYEKGKVETHYILTGWCSGE